MSRDPGPADVRARSLSVALDLATRVNPAWDGPPNIVTGIKLADVASELGQSRTALYRLWPTQDAFWRDLTEHLVFGNDYELDIEALPWPALEHPAPTPSVNSLPDETRVLMNIAQDVFVEDYWAFVRAALLGYADPPNVATARQRVEMARLEHIAGMMSTGVARAGRAFTSAFTDLDAAAALWCAADGILVMNRFDPTIAEDAITIDDGAGALPWRLFAYMVRCVLVESPTEPIDGRAPTRPPPGAAPAAKKAPAVPGSSPRQRAALAAASTLFTRRARDERRRHRDANDEVVALGQIGIDRVARAIKATPRGIYRVWPTVSALRLDVLELLLDAERQQIATSLSRLDRGAIERDPGGAIAAALFMKRRADRLLPGHAALAFLADGMHPGILDRFTSFYRATLALLAEHLERLVPTRARPSGGVLDTERLANLVLALTQGGSRLLRTCRPALIPRASKRVGHEALGGALRAILAHDPAA